MKSRVNRHKGANGPAEWREPGQTNKIESENNNILYNGFLVGLHSVFPSLISWEYYHIVSLMAQERYTRDRPLYIYITYTRASQHYGTSSFSHLHMFDSLQ